MGAPAFDDLLELYRWRYAVEDPSLLDWTRTMRVRPKITDPPVRDARPDAPARNTVIFGPAGERLAHADGSVQVVVLDEGPSEATLGEARRVARDAVFVWSHDGAPSAEWLREPAVSRPEVSLLVVAGDEPDRLDACLRALAETTPVSDAIEIAVTGAPAAGDIAHGWSDRLPLRWLEADAARCAPALRNLAAASAAGDLLVFLDDGTRPLAGWLRPLVHPLRTEPGVGAVGGKLVTERGAIEAAGALVFADGSLAPFGRGSLDADEATVGFVRDVHYVPGHLLATRAGLLRVLGGFDDRLGNGYEDADYGLRVRAAGRRVVYQPQAVALARERPPGAAATEAHTRFAKRWTATLADFPRRPERLSAETWDAMARVS